MAYKLTAITGTDTVGKAFTLVNANLEKQIISGNTSGENIRLVSKDGTIESISLSSITKNYLPISSDTYVRKSGDTMTGPLNIDNQSTFKTTRLSAGTITFYDDDRNSTINVIANQDNGGEYNINLIENDGYLPIVPNPSGNPQKIVGVNSAQTGWDYYTLSGSGNVNVSYNNNTILISGSASGGGGITGTYVSGLTNISGGINVISSITNNNLVNKPLTGGSNVSVYENNGVIFISAATGGGGITGTYVSGITSAGTGNILLLSSITNNNLVQRSISGGPNTTVYLNNNTIFISAATGGGSGTITSGTSLGGGSNVFSGVSSTNLVFRSLSGASGLQTAESGNLVLVRPATTTANQFYVGNAGGTAMVQSTIIQLDQNSNTIGINAAASPSTRLLFPAQAAGVSPLRFTSSSVVISAPVNGDVWYSSVGDTLQFRKNTLNTDFIFKDNNISLSSSTSSSRIMEVSSGGTLTASRFLQPFGVFNSVTSTTISSTTAETSIIPTGTSLIGSATLQASTSVTAHLVTGKKFRFTANGTINTKNSSPGNLTARMKLGSAVIASVSGFTLHADLKPPTNSFFIDSTFTIRTASSGGTVVGFGSLQTDNSNLVQSGPNIACLANLGQITVDCTTDKIFDFTFQFGTADASNTITINEATLEYLN